MVIRVEEVLEETKSRIRVGGELSQGFWTARKVRQGCPVSPLLFNILIADMKEEMGKVKWGGESVGGQKMYTLAYADDVVLLVEDEEGMRSMMERLERYLERKGVQLNTNKSKIMRFMRGGGRIGKRVWRWKGKIVEEVGEIPYLGYTLQRNGGQETHIREKIRKAAAVVRCGGLERGGLGKIRRKEYGSLTGWCGR